MEIVIAVVVIGVLFLAGQHLTVVRGKSAAASALADVTADARSWIDRLGGQISLLDPGIDPSTRQALADAAERHASAQRELADAGTAGQVATARRSAIEGLYYIRAARSALGLDPGPELPAPDAAGAVPVNANSFGTPQPQRSETAPYYFAGGRVDGRYAPAGWYSQPWWKTALVAGAAGVGGALVLDTLLDGFHHGGPGPMGMSGPGGFDFF
jgi:hypothetical protein